MSIPGKGGRAGSGDAATAGNGGSGAGCCAAAVAVGGSFGAAPFKLSVQKKQMRADRLPRRPLALSE